MSLNLRLPKDFEADFFSFDLEVAIGKSKPKAPPRDETITICVRDLISCHFKELLQNTGEVTSFTMKKTETMENVFREYAAQKGIQVKYIRFFRKDHRIREDVTPERFHYKSRDIIYCMP